MSFGPPSERFSPYANYLLPNYTSTQSIPTTHIPIPAPISTHTSTFIPTPNPISTPIPTPIPTPTPNPTRQTLLVSSHFPQTTYYDDRLMPKENNWSSSGENKTSRGCPSCLKGSTYFRLSHESGTTVYCNNCQQPYHHCPIHRTTLRGLGPRLDDPNVNKCQCDAGQSFLTQERWDQCFN